MAAQNPPSLVFTVVRRAGLWSLANAFVKPIRPGQDDNLVQRSIQELDTYWGCLAKMYGQRQIVGTWVCTLEEDGLTNLARGRVDGVDDLVGATVQAAMPVGGAA